MTPLRKGTVIKTVKDITIGTTLTMLLLGGASLSLQSCGSDNEEQQQKEETFKAKPVKSYITEMKPGEFKITDEVVVASATEAGAVVRYFDGHRDTLTVAQAQQLVAKDSTAHRQNHTTHHRSSLSSALLWGGMGYMMGNRMGSSYNEADHRRNSSGVYANATAYNKSAGIHNEYHGFRRTVASRPSGGRSGFFSRSRSGGFGG
jgi:hypothetical protein